MKVLTVLVTIFGLFVFMNTPALAKKPSKNTAKVLSERLQAERDKENWSGVIEAAGNIRKVYDTTPPEVLYFEGQAFYQLKQIAKAVVSLADYMSQVDDSDTYHEVASELYQQAEQALPVFCQKKAKSCARLGLHVYRRNDEPQNRKTAALLIRAGCEGGYAKACNNIAAMYKNGHGVTKDSKQTVLFFKKACDGKYASACEQLGEMYEQGEGVEANLETAIQYYQLDCAYKKAGGCEHLKTLGVVYSHKARPVKRVPPIYPLKAMVKKLTGTCEITFDVNAKGKTHNIRPVCSDKIFVKAVKVSVQKWVYSPKIIDSVAVDSTDIVTQLDFNLQFD